MTTRSFIDRAPAARDGSTGGSRRRSATPLVLALAVLAGCSANPAPVETDLGATVPAEYAGAPGDQAEMTTAAEPLAESTSAQPPWWESFDDANLDLLIQEALVENRDLRAASARVDAAAAQARIAGADLKPQVGADLTGARRQQVFVGLPIPGGDVLTSTSTTVGANLNISWEVDLWGRLRARKSSALAGLDATRLEYEAAALSLAGQTAKSWFAILEADAQVDVAQRAKKSRQTTLDRIRRRYDVGLAGSLEFRFAVSDLSLAESLLAQRERQADAARRSLQLLVNRYPSGELAEMRKQGSLPELPGQVPPGLPAELVARRPDLAAAESRLLASGYSVTEARRALYPRLTLTGSAGRASAEVEDLLDDDFSVWSLAGGLLAPLFQGGRLRAAIDLAEARQEETLALYVRRILGAFSEVEGSLAADAFLARREEALSSAVREADKALDLAQSQYSAGLVTYLAVLESQRQALNAESQLVSVQRQRLDTRVDLLLALGGDWAHSPGGATYSSIMNSTDSQETSEP